MPNFQTVCGNLCPIIPLVGHSLSRIESQPCLSRKAPRRPVSDTAETPPSGLSGPSPTALAPHGGRPHTVAAWFDAAAAAEIPTFDGTLQTARRAADAFARRAKADNTRRAYRAGVRAWCAWCDEHGLTPLPAAAADVVAFLAAERGRGLSVTTVDLRRAAIRYLHFIAGSAIPTAEARVAETMAGIRRAAADGGDVPAKKLAATIEILRQIIACVPDDMPGLRDRALLLVGFAGALRRSELAAIQVEHLEKRERGLRLTLPRSKGERTGKSVTVPILYGTTELCPVRALRRWQDAAGITEGAVFRRIWAPALQRPGEAPPLHRIGSAAIDARTVARIIQTRAVAAGFDRGALGGHSLKRGAMTTGMDRGIHPTHLKRLGRHRSYAVLDEYLEQGDPFETHALRGVL
jgi:site-specific recombinase XerC